MQVTRDNYGMDGVNETLLGSPDPRDLIAAQLLLAPHMSWMILNQ